MDFNEESIKEHKRLGGAIDIKSKAPLDTKKALSVFYTPGVAACCQEIAKDPKKVNELTWRKNTIAIITDGSAVLGLGDIGPKASLPVMEGKSAIFKEFGDVNAVPICLDTKDTEEIIRFSKLIEPCFGGINLEDISAPRCFEIEKRLKEELKIPVFHDDQHGTAIVTLAGIKNALKVANKNLSETKIVFSGAGAGGIATAKLLICAGAKHLVMCDSRGAIYEGRENLNSAKEKMAKYNLNNEKGSLQEALVGADIFIGVSAPDLLKAEDIAKMAENAIVFAMANPVPEIMPDEAKKGGALVVATGRSDFPNQVNNALCFPGLFRGILDLGAEKFTNEMFIAVAEALADMVSNPQAENIMPPLFDKNVGTKVAEAVKNI